MTPEQAAKRSTSREGMSFFYCTCAHKTLDTRIVIRELEPESGVVMARVDTTRLNRRVVSHLCILFFISF